MILTGVFIMNAAASFAAIAVPSSARSKAVVEKNAPLLKEEFEKKELKLGDKVYIRIFKEEHILEVWVLDRYVYKLFKEYPVEYYSGGLGTKTKHGDQKSPEGFYTIYPYSLNPSSSYHLAFNIGYPNAYERYRGYTGGDIMVHGSNVSIGCYAMTDPRIDEIYTIVQKAFEGGQRDVKVHIFPFKMTKENLERHKNDANMPFWQELVEGYEYFEQRKVPPVIQVIKGRYVIQKEIPMVVG